MRIADKKVSVSFFLNTNNKPVVSDKGNGKIVNTFPIYASVNYDGAHTQFKIDYEGVYYVEEKYDLGPVNSDENIVSTLDKRLSECKQLIYKALMFENENFGSDFRLAGLGKRLNMYQQEVGSFFGRLPIGLVMDILNRFTPSQKLSRIKIEDVEKSKDPLISDILDASMSVLDFLINPSQIGIKRPNVIVTEENIKGDHRIIFDAFLHVSGIRKLY